MIVVDLNVLIYVVNSRSPQHSVVIRWWHDAINGDETVGLPWIVISGFLRLTTRSGILPKPLTVGDAMSLIDDWLALESVVIVREKDDHWSVLKRLLDDAGTGGNLVTDAHLAAIAIGHGATLASCDNDFARFQGLRLISPIGAKP